MTRSEARRLRSDEGLSVAQIRARLGVSKHVLSEWLRGVPPPAWTARPNAKDDVRVHAVELRGRGWSVNDIAIELGIARSTAWQWVRHLPLDVCSDRAAAKRAHAKLMTDARWGRHRVVRDAARDALIAAARVDVGALSHRDLLLLGAAIYWCDGTKSKPWRRIERLQFVNTDTTLVRLLSRLRRHHRRQVPQHLLARRSRDGDIGQADRIRSCRFTTGVHRRYAVNARHSAVV